MSDLKNELKYPHQIANGLYMWVEKQKLDDLIRALEREQEKREELRKEFEEFRAGDYVSTLLMEGFNHTHKLRTIWTDVKEIDDTVDRIEGRLINNILDGVQAELDKVKWYDIIFKPFKIDKQSIKNKVLSTIQIKRSKNKKSQSER